MGISKNVSNEFLNKHRDWIVSCGDALDIVVRRAVVDQLTTIDSSLASIAQDMIDFKALPNEQRTAEKCKATATKLLFDIDQAKAPFDVACEDNVAAAGNDDQVKSWNDAKARMDNFLDQMKKAMPFFMMNEQQQGGCAVDRECVPLVAKVLQVRGVFQDPPISLPRPLGNLDLRLERRHRVSSRMFLLNRDSQI